MVAILGRRRARFRDDRKNDRGSGPSAKVLLMKQTHGLPVISAVLVAVGMCSVIVCASNRQHPSILKEVAPFVWTVKSGSISGSKPVV